MRCRVLTPEWSECYHPAMELLGFEGSGNKLNWGRRQWSSLMSALSKALSMLWPY